MTREAHLVQPRADAIEDVLAHEPVGGGVEQVEQAFDAGGGAVLEPCLFGG